MPLRAAVYTVMQVGYDVIQGRCPTCHQVVALAAGMLAKHVQCPRCGHRTTGTGIVDTETAVPVGVVPTDPPSRTRPVADPATDKTLFDPREGSVAKRARSDDASAAMLVMEKANGLGRWSLKLSQSIDDAMHGKWRETVLVMAVSCGGVAPLIDWARSDQMTAFTVITANLLFFGFWALGVAWLSKLRNDEGKWQLGVIWTRLATFMQLLCRDVSELVRLPGHLRKVVIGQILAGVGLTGMTYASCYSVVRVVWGLEEQQNSIRFVEPGGPIQF